MENTIDMSSLDVNTQCVELLSIVNIFCKEIEKSNQRLVLINKECLKVQQIVVQQNEQLKGMVSIEDFNKVQEELERTKDELKQALAQYKPLA